MSSLKTTSRYVALIAAIGLTSVFALRLRGNGLWNGLAPASAGTSRANEKYELKELKVVTVVIDYIQKRYVDPKRVKPKEMLLSALNSVQLNVAQVSFVYEEGAATAKVRVDAQEKEIRVDNIIGVWDITARLREVFAFLQEGLKGTEVDLREVEYAACNGMLRTLDPHSVLLSPEAYRDMNASTTGQFGGLGIVIQIRDQKLTVRSPMPGTPASRAGIKRMDRIEKIDNESTLNMGLTEAVSHLRGTPGSKVTLWVHRDGEGGWQGVRPFELVRETIKVKSVESKLLEGNVGYVRLKQFQSQSSKELDEALDTMRKNGELKGLVLDLRGNPGGLLDQAAKIVDKFVNEGPIVATVGNAEGREEKVAKKAGTEPNYPIVVLTNGYSASASEIVAGALKNHDRALIVGDTTFGKGSVQLIFNDLPDKAALKLTIAQYLTEPGDISIQGTGVVPDIQLDPMTADLQEMDLTVDGSGTKERDLSRSLSNTRIREGQRPTEVVRYNFSQKERQEWRDRDGEMEDEIAIDFPIRFARDVVAKAQPGKRLDQLKAAKALLAETVKGETAKVSQDLAGLGVDWSDAPSTDVALDGGKTDPSIEVKVETDRPGNEVLAGEAIALKLTVKNNGTEPRYRLFGITKSDNPLFDNKELVIGKLEPGKSKTITAPFGFCEYEGRKIGSSAPIPKDAVRTCKIPKDLTTRADWVTVRFEEAKKRAPAPAQLQVAVKSLERPLFAYSYQVADTRRANGDGRAQKGEGYTLYLTVKNIGKGKSFETQANLKNLSGDGILLRDGRFDLSNLAPGEQKRVAFAFDIENQLADGEAKVELSISDRDLRENVVEKIRLPIVPPLPLTELKATKKTKARTALFETADPAAREVAFLPAGSNATVVGQTGDFYKLDLREGRFGFARKGDLEDGAGATATLEEAMTHSPPLVELTLPPLTTQGATVKLSGVASDQSRLLDAYIFVGNRKVFYKSNRNGSDPKKMTFEAQLPLRPGINVVSVIARESPETVGRRSFIIRRDGPNGEYLSTPKNDDEQGESDD
jgi:carboxyl-terminal processing protease